MDEIKEIPGFVGYGVDRYGHVYSRVKAGGATANGPGGSFLVDEWKEMRLCNTEDGYKVAQLKRGAKNTKQRVHRLVLTAFVCPPPPGMVACHNDGNRSNNVVENLRWATHSDNHRDMIKHGTSPAGERSAQAKLTWAKVREMRRLAMDGVPVREICKQFGMSNQHTRAIIANKHWIDEENAA